MKYMNHDRYVANAPKGYDVEPMVINDAEDKAN